MPEGRPRHLARWSDFATKYRWALAGISALFCLTGAAFVVLYWKHLLPPEPSKADILVLGDSQLSFGAGPVLSDFFSNLEGHCREAGLPDRDLALLAEKRFAMIGTRSTSLQSWVTTSGRPWAMLCRKDKRWGVNASVWGTLKPEKKRYVQIGEGSAFQFCQPGRAPLDQLFDNGYHDPRLLMIFVGGNGAKRLARDPDAAREDAQRLFERLPAATGCMFMMTTPVYLKALNDTRTKAQANLRKAFAAHGDRCGFVDGHTPATRAAIEGNKQYFRRNKSGDVKDSVHANRTGAAKFLELRQAALCTAIANQLRAVRAMTR